MDRLTEERDQAPSGQSIVSLKDWKNERNPGWSWEPVDLSGLLGGTPKGREVLRKDDASGDSSIRELQGASEEGGSDG